MDKVLVLLSSYNGEKYIRQQMDSILSQKGCIVDILIRDDGSTDNTCEIIRSYKKTRHVKLLEENINLRSARSFLRLIENASEYDYYAFADQDDVWDKDKLISGLLLLREEKREALYCSNARVVDEKLNPLGLNVYKHLKYTNFESIIINGNFMGCTMIFNNKLKSAILSALRPSYCLMHDYYIAAFCKLIGGNVIYDDIAHMSYRIHGNNTVGISTNLFSKIKKQWNNICKSKPRIALQCNSLLESTSYGSSENRNFIKIVSKSSSSFKAKIKLLTNKDICYETKKNYLIIMINIIRGTL
ncbi:glycosyltransferase family 2 protein [Clostridium botulinum]|uniref:glycosyltransferase family 2 protein n=1 Tax=Clostridium botulinum TaxID=1491 RepID=UPI001C9B1FF8|nr:glycosyltransferase family 2 protein [Clostridium botulinum]MBY6811417.1 glycosyltransferase family 2 protein [Clostridium botulinum]MBY6824832.1 glycosyltransferase family 2 protein [Clostridium botulinum]MBY6835230.1 glycosyltransferase family 2 protein [Clostridium botulinum]MBY6973743.1 glycosyltransferase family 2 protein [Clostridium botulinum]HBJ1651642.1 glycosyltransferase family 2 protein [Clostridium botulinum]